jgi:serine/threonine-protein kinase HipA
MSDTLEAIYDGRRVGRISYVRGHLRFEYDDAWREDRASPLSLSMPVTRREHDDAVVRPFITGLLPDDNEVLRRWGQRFHVSPNNPFSLLFHVGEECAGAVQFVRPERAERWLAGEAPEGVAWLTNDGLIEHISDLVADRARARRIGDEGQFSLAGAQTKTALYHDPKSERWGIPKGATPTSHILKPNVGPFECYDLDEANRRDPRPHRRALRPRPRR